MYGSGGYSGYGGFGNTSGGYGGMGSYGGMSTLGRNYSTSSLKQGNPNESDPNRKNNDQPDPQRNARKTLFEEWFKMMGGLRSILEIGLAMIAIANFYTHVSAMVKKLTEVIKSMAGGIAGFLKDKIGLKIISKLGNPETRMQAIKGVILNFVRVFSILLICLSAKLRSQIRKDSQQKLQKLQQEYNKCKNGSLQLTEVEDSQNMVRDEQPDPVIQNANL